MSAITYRFSAALSAALLMLSILAVPASATHNLGLPHDPLDCVADPLSCVGDIGGGLGDPLGGGLGDPLGGGLPDPLGGGLPGGLPGGVGAPALPSTPADGAPAVVPPTLEQVPASKPARSKPDSSPKNTSPSAERVVVEPADGRTTSAGDSRRGSGSSGKASSRGSHSGRLGSDGISGDGPLPPSAASSSDPGGSSAAKRVGVAAFAGGIIHRIPEQYRWPVFVLACMATFFALNTLRERFRSMRALGRALTDSLTGLPNRLAFERVLAKEYRRADRYDRPLSMLLLDLDGFKEINDTQGHAAGDDVLRKAAVVISSRVRSDDLAARLGGDEFVVICPETSTASARELARSLEETLAEASIQSSIGVAEREAEDDGLPEYLVARADASMYRRKQRSGGGRERRSSPIKSGSPLAGLAGA